MRNLYLLLFFCFSITSLSQNPNDFTFDVIPVANDTYGFIVSNSTPVTINWGDGQQSTVQVGNYQYVSHIFNTNSLKTILINGQFDHLKITKDIYTRITQWGSSQWLDASGSFSNLNDIQFTTTDIPNFSQVTDMSYMFESSGNFNSDISNWDVSSVNNMYRMFFQAYSFNSPLNNWDVSSVIYMEEMFGWAFSYNQPMNSWDVSNVINMDRMFWIASNFNQPLSNWNISSLVSTESMFRLAEDFNQDVNSWNVTSINNMSSMFAEARSFNQPVHNWDVHNIADISDCFFRAKSFNQDLSNWQFDTFVNVRGFVGQSGMDSQNYDRLIESFASQNIQNQPPFIGGGLTYCNTFFRDVLIQQGWSFNGDQLDANCSNNIISGSIIFDDNSSGCDPNDPTFVNFKMSINSTMINSVDYSDSFGDYLTLISDGTYTVTPNPENPSYWNFSPPNVVVDFPAQTSPFSQDFCVTANGTVEDLEVTVAPLQQARPGFDTDYKVVVKNKGNQTASGSVTLDFEEDFMTLLSSTPTAATPVANQLRWSVSNLQPFQMEEYAFTMTMNTPAQTTNPLNGDDILTFTGTVAGTGTDAMPADNTMVFDQTVVNSYDPNDKTCLEGKTITPAMVGEYVHYMIRFENTGTASAVNIVVKDQIDLSQFDITTLIPLGGSDDYYTRVRDENVVEFIHENVNLDFNDATNDGYVLFKIKTLSTLTAGDTFDNTAEIFFDFNFPIITNTETVTIMITASLGEATDNYISVYPNPTRDFINITSNNPIESASVTDMNGRMISKTQFTGSSNEQRWELSQLSSGIYFVTIQSEIGQKVEKLIVE